MSYKILTIETVKAYILNISEIKEYLEEGEISIDEIGDGNVNFVYIVKNIETKKPYS